MKCWINQVTDIGERWFRGQRDSFLSYVDKVSKCHTGKHATGKVTETLSYTTDEVMEDFSKAGSRTIWTYGRVVWMLHVGLLTGQARSAPIEHFGYCAVETGGCCSQTRGHMQPEEAAVITASSYEREEEPMWTPEAGCVVIGLYDVQPGGGGMHGRDIDIASVAGYFTAFICMPCNVPFVATDVNY